MPVRDVVQLHEKELLRIADDQLHRMVKLNVVEPVRNLVKPSIVQNTLQSDKPLRLHA